MERRALGKGISALIPETPPEAEKHEKIIRLPLQKIKPNQFQPREHFSDEALQDLVQSIKEKGVIQPVLVRQQGEHYELIAGERRYRAAKSLNLNEIPAIVREVEDQASLELSLIENIQRQDLNPIEEARAYQYLSAKFNLTQDRLSEVLGKSRAAVANIVRLLKLPHEIQEELKSGRISFAHGRALLELEDLNQQRRLCQEVITNRLSVRELENLIKTRRPRTPKHCPRHAQSSDTYVAVIEEELQHILATRVRLIRKKKRGHILIEFYSQEDLERILEKLRGGKTT